MKHQKKNYHICVIDIGSPKLGNIGWCLLDTQLEKKYTGSDLDELFPLLLPIIKSQGLILGLEAPLFVPIRQDILLATKGRRGEKRRFWSAGAGAQVLAMNLPIMVYIFSKIHFYSGQIRCCLNEKTFSFAPDEIMIFEAFVSGSDKGENHINDAEIMATSCLNHAKSGRLPSSILEIEEDTSYFNLAAAALIRCNLSDSIPNLEEYCPIYKPDTL
jgi:hypothetical protein